MRYWIWLDEQRGMGTAYLESFESWSRVTGREDLEISFVGGRLAAFLCSASVDAEAELLFRRCLEVDEKRLGESHYRIAEDLNNLAYLLRRTDQLEEAEALMRRALAIDERSYGKSDLKVIPVLITFHCAVQ